MICMQKWLIFRWHDYNSYFMSKATNIILASVAILLAVSAFYFVKGSEQSLQTELPQCVARSTMISRGQVWVDKHIPYSQTKTYDGYRTDCSGFVSMCWELDKPGLTTFTMHTVAHNITKDQLQPGDAMNCDSEHIVLFAGWTDSAKTHYVIMEEANTQEGTVKKVVPYPYSYNTGCFHPIRFNNVC